MIALRAYEGVPSMANLKSFIIFLLSNTIATPMAVAWQS